jgi:ABC-type phosphate transport system substrate-binding protein
MHKLSRLIAGAVTVAATAALVAGSVTTASASPNDPAKGVVPKSYDIVGVGSNTTQFVIDQIAVNYDARIPAKTHSAAHPYLYSFDAVVPGSTSVAPTTIVPKAGCASITRPNGSGAGATALETSQKLSTGNYCIDFGRSSGGRKPTDPKKGPGGVEYVAFAKDAITWATRSAAKGGSDAPASLTLAQLKGIFTCKTTNWSQVGGKNGKISVFLPQAGSGTLSTWEKFMGITTLGSCVNQKDEENEGTYPGFNTAGSVWIYSIGAYVAQKYHSQLPGKKPVKGQNAFGTNVTGLAALGKISGISPLSTAKVPTINPKFPSSFWRTVYNIVRYNASTKDGIGKQLEGIFGSKAVHGYLCTDANSVIIDYGFVPTPLCGSVS